MASLLDVLHGMSRIAIPDELLNVQPGPPPESAAPEAQPAPADAAPSQNMPAFLGGGPPQPQPEPAMAAPSSDTIAPGLPWENVQPQAPAVQKPKQTKGQVLKKMLFLGLEGAAAGAGSPNMGEGFQRGAELPFLMASRKSQLEAQQAATEKEKTQTDLLKNTIAVVDPVTHATYQIPQSQLPAFLRNNISETGKNNRNTENVNSRESIAGGKNAVALRKQGLMTDFSGKQVPIPYEELTPAEQGSIDLKQAQEDAATAQAQLNRAKNDPNSAAFKAAYGRLQVARQNAATAAGKLGLDVNKFNADYFGVGPDGQSLPGAATTESGQPIGPRVANSAAPGADRLRRGDLAANAIQNLNDIKTILARRPDLIGKLAGHVTTFSQLIGNNDADLSAIGVAGSNYAKANAGVHGQRNYRSIQDSENAILNKFRNGPDAINGAIDEGVKSLNTFVQEQKYGKRPLPTTPQGAPKLPTPQAQQPTPQTHVFDVKAWKAANPKGDANAAIQQATRLGYQVLQ